MKKYKEWLKDRIFEIEAKRAGEFSKQKRDLLNGKLSELRICLKKVEDMEAK